MNDRILSLNGIHNFRDYGGYKARDGAHIRTGVLWRSGHHSEADKDDLDKIQTLGLATVIDLRGDSERALYPCLRHPEFDADVLKSEGETAGHATGAHNESLGEVKSVEEAHKAMRRLNESMPFRPNLVRTMTLYFEALAERDGASLLHCVAGKDRTGLAAALLHSLLGVHRDDIMADYMLTNVAGNIDRRIAAGASAVRSNFGRDVSDDVIRTLMSVHPSYLETAFQVMEASHGSAETYAEQVLGVTPERREQIAARYLV